MFINKKITISDFILSVLLIIFTFSLLIIAPSFTVLLLINPFIIFALLLYFMIRFSMKIHKKEINFNKFERITINSVFISTLVFFLSMVFLFFYFKVYQNLLDLYGLMIFATFLMIMTGVMVCLSLYLMVRINKKERKVLSNNNIEDTLLLKTNKKNTLSFVFTAILLTIFTCVLLTLNFSYNDPTLHLANLFGVVVMFVIGVVFISSSLFEKKFEQSSYQLFDVLGGVTASIILFLGSLGYLINFVVNVKKQDFFYFYFIILVILSGIYLIFSFISLAKYLKNKHSRNV